MKHSRSIVREAYLPLFGALTALLIASMILSLSFGTADISISETADILLHRTSENQLDASHVYIIRQIRIPRVLTSVLVGMGLAVAGVTFQALFRNPMAEPYILGVSSGAACGVAFGSLIGAFLIIPGSWGIPIFAFLGAIAASLVIYGLSGGMRSTTVTLLLSGVAMNFLLSSLMSLFMFFNRDQLENLVYWSMGSFSSANWEKLLIIGPMLIIGTLIIPLFSKEMDLLLLGDETAQTMGLHVRRTRIALLTVSTLITSSAVAMSGIIGFVGLIIPHSVRIIAGPSHRRLIPSCIISGGLFTLLADTLARSVLSHAEIPVGIITSLTGAPFFIYLLRRQRREVI